MQLVVTNRLIVGDMEWMQRAECKVTGVSTTVFFLNDETGPVLADDPENAGWYCSRCPVADDCLEYALQIRVEHGIWGGKTGAQRRRIIRLRRNARMQQKREEEARAN